MKHPCEIVVVDILPVVRKELSIELIKVHKMTMADVARLFKVSGTAVSQYVNGIRGDSDLIENSPFNGKFMEAIATSAEKLANKKSDIAKELCHICAIVKEMGIIEHIYGNNKDEIPVSECKNCPLDNI
ncbi:MAG: transcriptional regulator [Methanomassiliicoccaceae archaeon]|nr:transcriptional regulator [Methanomassiliicoccaceae archaeon]